jgi:hypothetical protein
VVILGTGHFIVRANSYNDRSYQAAAVGGAVTKTPPPMCARPLYARVKFSSNPLSGFGARNWGTGNLERAVFVGGSGPANRLASGEWFELYDGRYFKTDADIESYADVKGVAIQRIPGAVRVVLHGEWDQPAGAPLTNRERMQVSLELSNDKMTRSVDLVPDTFVNDPQHAMEYAVGKGTNDPEDDRAEIVSNLGQLKFVVNTNDDGAYMFYKNIDSDCKK